MTATTDSLFNVSLSVTEEHDDLRRAVSRWADTHCPPAVPRAALEAAPGELGGVWKELADQGWLGLHVAEEHGGQGFGLLELAVVLEELGAALAPGPLLPTVVVAAVLERAGTEDACGALLPGLADGSTPAAVYLGDEALEVGRHDDDGSLVVRGSLRPVLGASTARLVLAPLAPGGWCLLDAEEDSIDIGSLPAMDATRPLGVLTVEDVAVPASRVLGADSARGARGEEARASLVRDLATVLASAECVGGARWCLATASEYAKARVQFGRPIGQFQAVKHKLADMLAGVEQAAAAAWDAARAWEETADDDTPGPTTGTADADVGDERRLAAATAGAIAPEVFTTCAKDCVQILGGIGFTWEHDAQLYLKRATATRLLLGGTAQRNRDVAHLALSGARRNLFADLPAEADRVRTDVGPLVAAAARLTGAERRRFLVDSGLLVAHWPAPWGRDASPLEQIVLEEQLSAAGVERPTLGIAAWALPTLIEHGTTEQQERWVRPTLLGAASWCQLFSEPGAGSDLASLRTRAERVQGGWRLEGQKVWTSLAQSADWAMCLARSDPDAPKHDGITYFIVDMRSDGIDVRPLRELTGASMFNEVFLNGVFVPDDCVVGRPGAGWGIARTTLANERVSMSSGAAFGIGVESVLRQLGRLGDAISPGEFDRTGALLAEAQSIRLLAHRATLRSLSGMDQGAGAAVRKLVGAEHEQRVQELGLSLCGAEGAVAEGGAGRWELGFLSTRCLTIAGGTSEVQRNVMAERVLGQPRDPEPGT